MTKEFNELGLSDKALAAVEALGYSEPTPVQQQAIPSIIEGRDLIAAAKTGTGKTAAFSLPSLDKLEHARHGQGPLMLVVTPTRELAMQIEEVCRTIAKQTHHHVACIVGGVSYDPQISALDKGTDVLIATPGRLIDLMDRGTARLGQVSTLVLDEADRMLDMGFLPDMRRIVAACPKQRQTLLFSATIDKGIKSNMAHLLNDPVFVEIAHKGETADTVEQYIVAVDHRAKNDLLISLLHEKGGTRIIVFARTRYRVDTCCRKLRRAGFSAEAIHSDRSQNQRKRALDAFASGKCDILVATDVLARGIDVSDVNYVVNLDLPTQAEDYVHRIGRTGRAGESGFAVSFVSPETQSELREIEKLIGKSIPQMEVKSFDSQANEEALAAKATRQAANKDPELADAAKEYASQQKRRKQRDQQKDGNDQNRKPKAQQEKSKKKASAPNENRTASPSGSKNKASSPSSELRPGRAQRARREQQHKRTAGQSGAARNKGRAGGNNNR